MTARIQIPRQVKRGAPFEVRVAVQHIMETGFRYDAFGKIIPKNVVNTLVCRYNGEVVFRAELGSGISANPYLLFYTVAERSGELEFAWVDDAGVKGAERVAVTVIDG